MPHMFYSLSASFSKTGAKYIFLLAPCKLVSASHVCGLTFLVWHVSLYLFFLLYIYIYLLNYATQLLNHDWLYKEMFLFFKYRMGFTHLLFIYVFFSAHLSLSVCAQKIFDVIMPLPSKRSWFSLPWYMRKRDGNLYFDFPTLSSDLLTILYICLPLEMDICMSSLEQEVTEFMNPTTCSDWIMLILETLYLVL